MKILIKDRTTGLFFRNFKDWVGKVEEAKVFGSALEGFRYSQMHALGDTEIVFQLHKSPVQRILEKRAISAACGDS